MAGRTKAELMAGFIAEGAVGGLVNSLADVPDDPQVIHNQLLVETDHGGAGRVRGARPAAKFAKSPAQSAGPAPALGEHGRAVLAALGFDKAEVDTFIADRSLVT
jgi:crotonobetainyl-CoA:carnitine CoA-transferase CaiB-like acyl-CoA transferase